MAVTQATNDESGGAQDHESIINAVPEDRRTPDRDVAAREILSWQEQGEWPLTGPEMERMGEYSAQHYRHTVSLYELDTTAVSESNTTRERESVERGGVDIDIPKDADVHSYARGYIAGYLDEKHS